MDRTKSVQDGVRHIIPPTSIQDNIIYHVIPRVYHDSLDSAPDCTGLKYRLEALKGYFFVKGRTPCVQFQVF